MSTPAPIWFKEEACSSPSASTAYLLKEILHQTQSKFCAITIGVSELWGRCLFLDTEIQSSSSDEAIYHEHLVHPVMAATSDKQGRSVLIIGGGEGATAREVLKWDDVTKVDMVDIDGELIEICKEHLKWAGEEVYSDKRLTIYPQDIRIFFDEHKLEKYDVVLMDLTDPDAEELSAVDWNSIDEDAQGLDYALYGPRFWKIIQDSLHASGAIASHVGPVSPGGDASVRRAGLEWCKKMLGGGEEGEAYKVGISSFQSDWGFFMSCKRGTKDLEAVLPKNLKVYDKDAETMAFLWPKYWFDKNL